MSDRLPKMRDDWNNRARVDPYHAVLSKPGVGGWDEDREAFMATGEDTVARIVDPWLDSLPVPAEQLEALDYGAGVGRCTIPLARRFATVLALDVSDRMLAPAIANAVRAGVREKIVFRMTDGRQLKVVSNHYGVVFTCATLQHVPDPHTQLLLLEDLYRTVCPGGVLLAQVNGDVTRSEEVARQWQARRESGELDGWDEAARMELDRFETWMCTALRPEVVSTLSFSWETLSGYGTDDWWIVARRPA